MKYYKIVDIVIFEVYALSARYGSAGCLMAKLIRRNGPEEVAKGTHTP
jgi:hypothetical protein